MLHNVACLANYYILMIASPSGQVLEAMRKLGLGGPKTGSWGLGSSGTENRFNKRSDLNLLIGNILRDTTHLRRLPWFAD
jgi:hypothetical protein